VRLNTDPDEIGSRFTVEVNGKPIFCRGANWIPDDCFPTRVDQARYRRRITQAVEADMNMLRVWGGGLYEAEAFYDVCDELGVMVWQDFLFACSMYPEGGRFRALVEAEARYQIARLSRHASLVLWCGNNENIWFWFTRGWEEKFPGRPWGAGLYFDLLPKLVAELDPTRPYWPGSPYSGSMEIDPIDDRHGNEHVWDAWNREDYTIYRSHTPRFVSEFGHQAPPTYPTLRRAIPADQLAWDSPAMLHHQKAREGNIKLNTRLAEHFQVPADFDDWLYLTQLNQARAIGLGVERFRSRRPVCMGTLYWQLNDCWPVSSWAAIDGDGRAKPLWFATRRFYAERLLSIQPEGEKLALFAVNDTTR
jgi:beta-mannosidase